MNKRLTVSVAFAGFLAMGSAGNASALTEGKTAGGLVYATGGVTVGDLRKLLAERDRYALWVTTAARGSGAFLSDVQLRITDRESNVVLDTILIGPWLFVDLPPGTYAIEATLKNQVQERTTRIDRSAQRQAIIYFESPAEVSPDWTSPFVHSPYGN